jgi:hypothetical protein
MDIAGIRESLEKRPFERFALRLADGRRLPVEHPEAVALGRRRIVVVQKDDSWSVIEPLRVVSIDYEAPGTRGAASRRPSRRQ